MGMQINQLTATTPSAGQSLPVYDPSKGDTRRWSLSDLLTWIQANLTFPVLTTQYAAPLAGTTVQVTDSDSNTHLILTPAGGLATLTLKFPALANCVDKQEFVVNTTQTITALTLDENGASIVGFTDGAAFAADAFMHFKFDATMNTWYRIG